MKPLVRLLDRLVRAAALAAAIMTVAMMLLVTVDVAGRGLFGSPITGTVEIASAYCMVAIAFLPLGLITLRREHIVVGIFTERMPRRWRSAIDAAAAVVTLVYSATITWQALIIAVDKTGIREAREAGLGLIEIWPARWLVAAGFALMACCMVIRLSMGPDEDSSDGSRGARGNDIPDSLL